MRRLFMAAALLLAALIPAASASAAVHHPTGEFANFGECPLSNSKLWSCLFAETNSGFIQMGAKTVPIKNPVVLQGGLELTETGDTPFVPAEGGVTLTKAAQPVPGGLLGVTAPSWWPQLLKDLFNETINNGFTGVTATMELAGPVQVSARALLNQQGTAVALPVKVKLGNSFLGSNCYIGSNSNPIRLNLTDGTTSPPPPNTPITGTPGTGTESAGGALLTLNGQKLVDNSFAAPGANGCGGILFSWAVDPFVNSIVGVPSPAGTNTAVLEGRLQLADPAAVKASE
jgi:hypothetical protein